MNCIRAIRFTFAQCYGNIISEIRFGSRWTIVYLESIKTGVRFTHASHINTTSSHTTFVLGSVACVANSFAIHAIFFHFVRMLYLRSTLYLFLGRNFRGNGFAYLKFMHAKLTHIQRIDFNSYSLCPRKQVIL
jgi:hypothetical protein